MRIWDVICLSTHNMIKGGIKTVLCITAIFIGVFSYCIAVYVGNIATEGVNRELDNIGIRGAAVYSKGNTNVEKSHVELAQSIKGVENIMPFSFKIGSVQLNKTESMALILEVDDTLEKVWNVQLVYGRGFLKSDIETKKNVAIIDSDFAEKVYKRDNIIGKEISVLVGGTYEKFEIIGICRPQKNGIQSLVRASIPEIIYIPYTAADGADMLAVSCASGFDSDNVSLEIIDALEKDTGVGYSFGNLDIYMDSFVNVVNVVALMASLFAGIALVVGGIGIMSNMINATEQRRNEIGIYISMGASKKDVVMMYLFEALIISLVGGMIGWGVSTIGFRSLMGSGISMTNMQKTAASGIGVSAACGIAFGIIPAIKAAFMDPIKAIRK